MASAYRLLGQGIWRSKRPLGVKLALASICVLAAGLSCPSEKPAVLPVVPSRQADLVVFFTGSDLGSLRPCGCSGGQLGGIEKRPAVFDTVPPSNRLIVETGSLVEGDREQDLIKFRIFVEAMRLLQYDVVHLTPHDLEIADRLGLRSSLGSAFDVIYATGDDLPPSFTKRFVLEGEDIVVNVASLDPELTPLDRAAELFEEAADATTVDILLLRHCAPDVLETPALQALGIDCVICPSESDEPLVLSEPGERPIVFTVGCYGRHICRLRVAAPDEGSAAALELDTIPVTEELPDHPALVQLYRQYQQLVAESDLLEKHPRVPLPNGLAFVGSKACRRCHEYEYDKWSTKAHAAAFATLVEVNSHRDPECVICHVVGLDYESGFITEEKTPHLEDVGCENCHGPGSQHVITLGQMPTSQPKMVCLNCHTPEKSAGYTGHEEEYMKKIVHWREPDAVRNVQQP